MLREWETPPRRAVSWLMLDTLWIYADRLLGLHVNAEKLEFSQMAFRALVVFCFAVFLARFADRRVLGHNAGFDIMLLVVLGSVLSRGINGQAEVVPVRWTADRVN